MATTRSFSSKKKLTQKFLSTLGAFSILYTFNDAIQDCTDEPWRSGFIFTVGVSLIEDIVNTISYFINVSHPLDKLRSIVSRNVPNKVGNEIFRSFGKAILVTAPAVAFCLVEENNQFIDEKFLRNLLLSTIAGGFTIPAETMFDKPWSPGNFVYRLTEGDEEKNRSDAFEVNLLHAQRRTMSDERNEGEEKHLMRTRREEQSLLKELYNFTKNTVELNFYLNLFRIFSNDSDVIKHLVPFSALLLVFDSLRRRIERWAFTPDEVKQTFYDILDEVRTVTSSDEGDEGNEGDNFNPRDNGQGLGLPREEAQAPNNLQAPHREEENIKVERKAEDRANERQNVTESASAKKSYNTSELSRLSIYSKHQDRYAAEIKTQLESANYQTGAALDKGDCFFDSVAQGLSAANIKIPGNQGVPDYKKIRLLCDAYLKNKTYTWIKDVVNKDAEYGGDDYFTCLSTIQFSQSEMEEHKKNNMFSGYATWGRPHIEGRMLCHRLNIRMHVIDFFTTEGSDQLITAHKLIDGLGARDVAENAPELQSANVIHIANYRKHYVPIFPLATLSSSLENQGSQAASNNNQRFFGPGSGAPYMRLADSAKAASGPRPGI